MRVFSSLTGAAFAGLLAAACSDPTAIQPRPPLAGVRNASLTSSRPELYPNSQKYRDTGAQPALGQSGSATVSVRALLGSSGGTDVEVTTGTFDPAAPSGTLATVQVKSQADGAAFTNNYTGLTSTSASFPYTGIAHGTPVHVQAIVHGVDGARNDIVAVSDNVHFRPDLVAETIEGPASAPVGGAVNFYALIGEQMGDLGAFSSCVLYVDGSEVDRGDDIWVDKSGAIACFFTHIFTTKGTHTIELRVENVRPGDYDDSNNRATTSIRVVDPNGFTAYSLQAWDTYTNRTTRFVSLSNGVLYDETTTETGRQQYVSLGGIIPRLLDFPIRLQGDYVTNGATFALTDQTYESAPFVGWQQGYCDRHAVAGGASTYVCVYTGGHLAGYTFVQYDWLGADVRYHSDSYSRAWSDNTSVPVHEVFEGSQVTPLITFGADLTGRLLVFGAGDAVAAATAVETITLSPYETSIDFVHPTCTAPPAPVTCRELHIRDSGLFGYTDFGSWPRPTP